MSPADFEEWLKRTRRPPLVMGILNVTPDSFSDGGAFLSPDSAIRHGREMLEDGAAIIDIGGESTRPGAPSIEVSEQIRRTCPVIEHLARHGALVSIDTTSVTVARAAIAAGAAIINDISAGRADPGMLAFAADSAVPIILMHMLGTPQTMQTDPVYRDVVAEVRQFLADRSQAALEAGVKRHRILLDVGIGFGKTVAHNLALLQHHQEFATLGYPMLLGTSRKSFIGAITQRPVPAQRVFGTAATIAWGVTNGADLVRVHDVREMREVVDMVEAIRRADETQSDAPS